jgi:hypothetical protein
MRRVGAIATHVGSEPNPSAAAATTVRYDLVLRGGTVYCAGPGHEDGAVADVAVLGDRIAAVEPPGSIPPGAGREERDVSGLLVTPGLIDIHAHVYENVMQGAVNPDSACLARCTTTAVDCGSAGTGTIDGFVKYIADMSHTRCLAFVNMSKHGIAAHPCVRCVSCPPHSLLSPPVHPASRRGTTGAGAGMPPLTGNRAAVAYTAVWAHRPGGVCRGGCARSKEVAGARRRRQGLTDGRLC